MAARGAPLLRAPLTLLTPTLRNSLHQTTFNTFKPLLSSRSASDAPASRTPYSNREISDSLSDIIPSRGTRRSPRPGRTWGAPTTDKDAATEDFQRTKRERESQLLGHAIGYDPKRDYGIGSAVAGSLSGSGGTRLRGEAAPAPVRLDAYVGRSVLVDARNGLASAIRQVEMGVRRNGVKMQEAAQRFHERAGLKRKRLRSVRWRRRFKLGFQATVAKVEKMRRMGW